MKRALLLLAALAAFAGFGYTPVAYTNSFTRDGVTYVQRGALGTSDYVATNIDSFAVGKVQSVNGKTGDVVLVAKDIGAVPTNITEEVCISLSELLNLFPNGTTNGVRMSVNGLELDILIDTNANMIVFGDRKLSDYGITDALKDDISSLTNSVAFTNAVAKVSPPTVLPDRWALSNVTNNQGGTVSAVNVSAFPISAFVEEFNTSHKWNYGDFCLHEGQLWIAVDDTSAGRPWDEYRWEVTDDYTTPLKAWLNDGYINLGRKGTNVYDTTTGTYLKYINVGIGTDSKYYFLRLTPYDISLQSEDETKYVRISPSQFSYKDGSGHWSDILWSDIRTTANASAINSSSIDQSKTYLYTSPYHVYNYLTTQNYLTQTAGDSRYYVQGSEIAATKIGDSYNWQDYDGGYYYKPTTWTQGNYTYTQITPYWWTDLTSVDQRIEYHIEYDRTSGRWRDVQVVHAGTMIRTQVVHAVVGNYTDTSITFGSYTYTRSSPSTAIKLKQVIYNTDLNGYVTTARTVNGKALSENIILTASDITDAVPNTRKVNGQALTSDITIQGMTADAVVLTNGTLKTYDGRAVDAMDYPALTNTVNEIKAKFYDQPLQVEWTLRMVNGDMKLYATTNVNTSVLNN